MRRYDVEAIIDSICDKVARYAENRRDLLTVEKAVELHDIIMSAIDEFDENYSETDDGGHDDETQI